MYVLVEVFTLRVDALEIVIRLDGQRDVLILNMTQLNRRPTYLQLLKLVALLVLLRIQTFLSKLDIASLVRDLYIHRPNVQN